MGGSEVGRSQNGSIDNGVFLDSRADCAMSYRFTICRLSCFVVPISFLYFGLFKGELAERFNALFCYLELTI